MWNQVASTSSFGMRWASYTGAGVQRSRERSNYDLASGYDLADISEKNIGF